MRNDRGLTLVELLVAIAIAGMLMAAAMAAVTSMAQADKISQRTESVANPIGDIKNLLSADIANARGYRPTAKGFEMQTLCSIDGRYMELRHLPCTVAYEVQEIAGQKWLIRIQSDSDNAKPYKELVSRHVVEIAVAESANKQTDDNAQPVRAASTQSRWQRIPPAMTLKIKPDTNDRPTDLVIQTR